MCTARRWIDSLGLQRHPEGGWFRETYRSSEEIAQRCLPERFGGDRAFSTAIYFLLEGDDFSALHCIKQDEVWHFYDGCGLTVHILDDSGAYSAVRLGRNLGEGQAPQFAVRAGSVFGATVDDRSSYSLVGCTVAPGFDFADFEMPSRRDLVARYPQQRELIQRLTR